MDIGSNNNCKCMWEKNIIVCYTDVHILKDKPTFKFLSTKVHCEWAKETDINISSNKWVSPPIAQARYETSMWCHRWSQVPPPLRLNDICNIFVILYCLIRTLEWLLFDDSLQSHRSDRFVRSRQGMLQLNQLLSGEHQMIVILILHCDATITVAL